MNPAMISRRVLAGTLISAPVVLVMVVYTRAPRAPESAEGWLPPWWVIAGQVAIAVLLHLWADTVGYRTRALPTGLTVEEGRRQSLVLDQERLILRFTVLNAFVLASIPAAYVVPTGGAGCLLIGTAIGAALLAFHIWPWRRPIDMAEAALGRDSGVPRLREALGMPSEDAVIREL